MRVSLSALSRCCPPPYETVYFAAGRQMTSDSAMDMKALYLRAGLVIS